MSRSSTPSPVCEPSPAQIAAQIAAPIASSSISPANSNRLGYLEAFTQFAAEVDRNIAAGAPGLVSDDRSPQELSLREVETLLESPTLPQQLRATWVNPARARLFALDHGNTKTLLGWIEHELQTARHLRRGRLLGARLKTLIRQREIASRSRESSAAAQTGQDEGYEIRLNLIGVDQSTWRTIQVPDMTLDRLSDTIRASFEWDARAGHCFSIHGVPFSPWRCAGPFWPVEQEAEDEFDWTLSELLGTQQIGETALGATWFYQLGPWLHEIIVGRRIQGEIVLPHCLDGAGSLNAVRPTALAHLRLVTATGVLENVDEEGVVAARVPRSTTIANPGAATFDVVRTTTAMRRCA